MIWPYAVKRLVLFGIGIGLAYVLLLFTRKSVDPEIRGLWAGASGMIVMDLLENVIPPRKKS